MSKSNELTKPFKIGDTTFHPIINEDAPKMTPEQAKVYAEQVGSGLRKPPDRFFCKPGELTPVDKSKVKYFDRTENTRKEEVTINGHTLHPLPHKKVPKMTPEQLQAYGEQVGGDPKKTKENEKADDGGKE